MKKRNHKDKNTGKRGTMQIRLSELGFPEAIEGLNPEEDLEDNSNMRFENSRKALRS